MWSEAVDADRVNEARRWGASDKLRVAARTSDGLVTVFVAGEIELATAEQFGQALKDVLSWGAKSVDVDMLEVAFIGSLGINALVDARRTALEQGIELRVAQASRQVRRVLELMGLADYMA